MILADFTPMVLPMLMMVLAAFVVLAGIAIGIGIIAAICIGAAIALGILSSSVLIGFFQRRLSSGLRAMHYQICAIIALPCGIAVLFIGCRCLNLRTPAHELVATGSIAGICAGLLFAFVLDRSAIAISRRITGSIR